MMFSLGVVVGLIIGMVNGIALAFAVVYGDKEKYRCEIEEIWIDGKKEGADNDT